MNKEMAQATNSRIDDAKNQVSIMIAKILYSQL